MIRISFKDSSDERLVAALREKGPLIVSAIQVELDKLMFQLLRQVQANLSGGVLKTRTGKLLGSANKEPTIITGSGKQIVGTVSVAGGVAWYGQVHERGGQRTFDIYPVNKKALAFFPQGSAGAALGFKGTRQLYAKAGVNRGSLRPSRIGEFAGLGGVVVQHVRHPPLPKRPFAEVALEEMREQIIAGVYRAAASALA